MADELDLDLLDGELEQKNKVEKRIKDLSEKVRLTSEDRDEKDKLLAQERAEKESLQKERDFLNSFGDQLARYPDASAFKDKIKERVLKGYSVEDATAAVLVSEGKYTAPVAPHVETRQPVENYAGGSAATNHQPNSADKPLGQLTRDEKRARLLDAESRGDLGVN